MVPLDEIDDDQPAARSVMGNVGRLAVAGIVIASFAVWFYAFSIQILDRTGQRDIIQADVVENTAFQERAEQACAAAVADIDAMPGALDAADGAERGQQILASTARYETMLDEIEPLVSGTERDLTIMNGWLGEWRVLLDDRYRHAGRITEDGGAQFLITDTGATERLDKRITRVANANRMPSCAAPGDLG
ncbi:MAG: hypothetical protein AAF467_26990 [Actinomycetota bacterium]